MYTQFITDSYYRMATSAGWLVAVKSSQLKHQWFATEAVSSRQVSKIFLIFHYIWFFYFCLRNQGLYVLTWLSCLVVCSIYDINAVIFLLLAKVTFLHCKSCYFVDSFIMAKSHQSSCWCVARNHRLNRDGNLCKGTQVSKIVARAKIDARVAR